MSGFVKLPSTAGSGGGVTSLNTQTGALTFLAGTGITITPGSGTLTITATGGGTGTVTSVSVVSANGFAGTVANATTTPAITLTVPATGILRSNGTAIGAATAGTDYVIPSGSITGTATNITASSNSTLVTLSALSLPYSQVTGGPSANAITALTGDATATGPGSVALTLATVNSSPGSFGSASTSLSAVVNGKGLITSLASQSIQIAESQVTNLTSDLAAKQSTALASSHILVGNVSNIATDVAASGDLTLANTGAFTITSIQGTAISGTTGTGNVVFAIAPTLSNPVVGTQAAADNSTKGASTAYVTAAINSAISGVNPAVAVQAATTAASDTSGYTYNNGASGIGATLTGPTNTALTVDGYTFTALTQRLLVKNDTQSPSGAFNGIYTVTQLQTAILPLILTRALDYDQPSDINNTGAIPVINGTVNGTTSWVETAQINTVGTDPLAFTKFTGNPASYLLAANNLSDVASATTSFNNISPTFTQGSVIFTNSSGKIAQDNANFFWDATNHRLGIGTTTPTDAINIVGQGVTRLTLDSYGTASSPVLNGRMSRGVIGTPTATQADDSLLSISGKGYNGSALTTTSSANISLHAAENWTPTTIGGYIRLMTVPAGSTTLTERVRLTSIGNLLLNTTTDDASHTLQVNGTILGTGATISGLTASSPVFTDGSKNLTSSGTVPVANGGRFTKVFNYYTSSTTMADPGTGCQSIRIRGIGGGGAGGSGAAAAGATAHSGGAGGSPGAFVDVTIPYSSVTSWPVTITIGAATSTTAGTAGAGTPGAAGNSTSFGTYVVAIGGLGGAGGITGAGTPQGGMGRYGSGPAGTAPVNGINGFASGGNSGLAQSTIAAGGSGFAGSGGGGGGMTTAAGLTGGNGGSNFNGAAVAPGGANTGAAGTNGTNGDTTSPYVGFGGAGGSGAGSATAGGTAFAGGNGGLYGAGGGGGSATTTITSGAGGSGAQGFMSVIAE